MSIKRTSLIPLVWVGVWLAAQTVSADRVAADGAPDRVIEVEMRAFRFVPDTVRLMTGDVVRWINKDPVGHTAIGDGGEWESPLIGPNESFEYRFEATGTFPYHCTPHPFMHGVVIVEQGT